MIYERLMTGSEVKSNKYLVGRRLVINVYSLTQR